VVDGWQAGAALTMPVRAALPVVSSTNQGPATIAIIMPTWDIPSAEKNAYSPRRSATAGAASATVAALRPPSLERRRRAPTKVRFAPKGSAAS
jgi:hypothetical protein